MATEPPRPADADQELRCASVEMLLHPKADNPPEITIITEAIHTESGHHWVQHLRLNATQFAQLRSMLNTAHDDWENRKP